jgi:hypothetical protein
VSGPRRVLSIYARIGRTYRAWGPALLIAATIVFVPLGVLDAIAVHFDVEQFDLDSGIKVAALMGAVAALTATSLLGEVFYSGAVATALTHPEGERPPSLWEIAKLLDYRRLIAVDVVYVLLVVLGLILGIVPGFLLFVWLGLAGPVVEIEKRTVFGSLRRSFRLVSGSFWAVAFVLVPIELVGDAIGEGIGSLVHAALGHNFVGTWLADAVANVALSPVFAIASVLLTIELIARRDGAETAPRLNRGPAPLRAAVTA